MEAVQVIPKLEHHEQQDLCCTRATYRQGRKLTAVKVAWTNYTVNDESQHLIICGVPKLQLTNDVKKLVTAYGTIKKIESLLDYPTEDFTEAFHVQYQRIQSARVAKRFVDGKNFYGGLLHVFYAPELESVAETRQKLNQRRRDVVLRIIRHKEDPTDLNTDKFEPREQYHRKKKYPTLPLTKQRLMKQYPTETLKSIYDGMPRSIDSRPHIAEQSYPNRQSQGRLREPISNPISTTSQDRQILTNVSQSLVVYSNSPEQTNYRGRPTNKGTKVKVIRPTTLNTKRQAVVMQEKMYPVVKKIENGITIKILPKGDDSKKRIVMKNPSTSLLNRPSDDLRDSIKKIKTNIRGAMQNN